MLQIEVGGIGAAVTNRQVAGYVYARHRGERYKHTTFDSLPSDRNETVFRYADGIRTELLGPKDFFFSSAKLDDLAKQVCIVDQFSSWANFIEQYKNDLGAIYAEKYANQSFSSLPVDIQDKIYGLVEKKIALIHLRSLREGRKNKIIKSTDEITIRSMTSSEFLAACETHLPTFPKVNLSRQNDMLGFVLKDDFDETALIIIFPLSYSTMEMMAYTAHENIISPLEVLSYDDLQSEISKGQQICLHIATFWSKSKQDALLLIYHLERIFELFIPLDYPRAKISIIAKDKHEQSFHQSTVPLWDILNFGKPLYLSMMLGGRVSHNEKKFLCADWAVIRRQLQKINY